MITQRVTITRHLDTAVGLRCFIRKVLNAYNESRISEDEVRVFMCICDRLMKCRQLDIDDWKRDIEIKLNELLEKEAR